jgi:hypothetical protein
MKILWTNWELLRRDENSSRLTRNSSPLDIELRHDLSVTRLIVIIGFLLGVATLIDLWFSSVVTDGFTILFWAFACYATGALIGFLFGVPRVEQGHATDGKSQFGQANGGAPDAIALYRLLINTNLDDVSDWLTKIVVGIGLVELRKLPDEIYKLATAIAGEGHKADVPLIIAVILYFSVMGFMSGYLTTRMFFQRAFRASDLAAGGIGDSLVDEQTVTKTQKLTVSHQ